MADGAANEAQIVISTDYSTMKDFVEFTKKGLDDVKEKGKGAFREIGKEAFDFTRSVVGGTMISAGQDLANAVTAPLRKGLGEAIGDAEKFRKAVSQIALSAGQDFKKVGAELDKLSSDTRRSVEEINAFIGQVKTQTGDRAGAVAAVRGASMEARARGVELGELGGEIGTLQRRWSIADTTAFYDKQRAGAKAIGVDPNKAAALFGRQMPMLEKTAMSAEEAAQFSASMLKAAGGDQQVAMEAGQSMQSFVGGHLPYIEKTLQSAGLLGKGQTLHDDLNRPQLAKALQLMRRYQLKKRGQKGLDWVSQLHLPGAAGAIFSRGLEQVGSDMDAQRQVPAGADIESVEQQYENSEQGKADAAEQARLAKDRQMGGDLLPWYERARARAGGWAGWATGRAVEGLGLGSLYYGGRKAAGALAARLGGGAARAAAGAAARGAGEAVASRGAAGVAGEVAGGVAARYGAGALAGPAGVAALLGYEAYGHVHGVDQPEIGGDRSAAFRRALEIDPSGVAAPASARAPDPRQAAELQAKANADEQRRGAPIPVVIRGLGIAPSVGIGGQK